jgi:hypothetical protein
MDPMCVGRLINTAVALSAPGGYRVSHDPRRCHRRQRDARLALANAQQRYDVIGNFPV